MPPKKSTDAKAASQALLDEAEYMEDLESKATANVTTSTSTPASSQEETPSSTPTASTSKKTTTSTTTSTTKGTKRQINLTDMYSVSTVPKRQRVSESGEASSSTQPSGQVRLVNGLRPFNSIAFNVDTYKASLSEKEARLLSLECDTMGRTWLKLLGDEIKKPYFLKLKEFLWNAGVQDNREKSTGGDPIYPPPKDIYHWSRATPLGKVKIVIIGQDPYHGPGQAHGLCFSVRKGVAVPPSLRNMYREIQNDYPGFKPPSHGELTNWAESGVLLLNTSLTVKARSAGSHSGKGWEEFTDAIVSLVDKYGGASLSKTTEGVGRGVVFLVWGAHAAKRVSKLSKTKHLILSSVHPSPLSANKGGWFGNQHFRKANDWLEKKYGADAKIDWTKLS